ncbi:DUF4838 domain-containing protein [Paenibacillus nasutitermitis]|uniref:Alpha glucuronidase N-terminal domain-containing protein n=1 Tax=Paenibacillus nasutitermitis TaxID=1652958 RepID=A0A917DSI6_9BACL|nr:DUF4838 domain-containing protein [Paenibacillus nasutitermitis]GGD62888.1 hypothetical protein GCM10010911_20790 [Paenibacillus nasutitermitis]
MIKIVNHQVCGVNIVCDDKAISLFAAEELQKYIAKATNGTLPICGAPVENRPSIFIGGLEWCKRQANSNCIDADQLEYDGYCIVGVHGNLILTSREDRGILFAVYALLEHIGCKWFFPGPKGEFIPSLEEIVIDPTICQIVNPDFEIRSFMDASHKNPSELWSAEMVELIDWCSKSKLNSITVHHEPHKELEGLDRIKSEIKKRSLLYEFGGHGTQWFVDRELFESKPYLFREKDGVRRKDGNFCGSSDEAIALILKGVENVLATNDGIDILHLWFDDVYDGSWCECSSCRHMSIPDQIMNVINKIYAEISVKYPAIKGDMVLYHDTLDAKEITIAPHPKVVGYIAPRERCYAHSIDDSSCELNRKYYSKTSNAVEVFGHQVYVVEYYTDMILYSKMKMHFPQVIARDLAEYKKTGVNKITTLGFLRYSWWAYDFNLFVYANSSWDVNYDYRKGLNAFCEQIYPASSGIMLEYYRLLEQASAGILAFCGYKDVLHDIRNIPPQSPEFQKQHIEKIKMSLNMLESCVCLLGEALVISAGKEKNMIQDEIQILYITQKETEATYHQMMGRYLQAFEENADKSLIETYMDKAIEARMEIRRYIESVSDDLKGSSGHELFADHLCSDMIDFVDSLKKEAANDKP